MYLLFLGSFFAPFGLFASVGNLLWQLFGHLSSQGVWISDDGVFVRVLSLMLNFGSFGFS